MSICGKNRQRRVSSMPIASSDNKLIAKNTLYMYLRMLIIMMISLYASRVVLSTLGVDDFGIYNVVGGIVALFAFLNGALSSATQRIIAFVLGQGDSRQLTQTFCMCINVHVIIAVLIVLLAETAGLWLVCHKLVIPATRMGAALFVYHCSVASAAISIIQVPFNACVSAHEKFNVYAAISILDALMKLGIVFLIQYADGDLLRLYGLLMLLAHVLQISLYATYCRRKFNECAYHFIWNRAQFGQIFNFTSWSLIGNIADTLSDQGVNVLLNMFFGPAVNAARGIAVQVKMQVSAFVTNFQSAANPQIVKLYAVGEQMQMIDLVIRSSKISFFLFFLVMFPLCLEMNPILTIWLSIPPAYLYEFTIIVLVTVLLQSMGGTLQMAIQATGQIRIYHLTVSVAKLTCIPVSYLGLRAGAAPTFPLLVVMVVYFGVVAINIAIVKHLLNFPVRRYLYEVIAKDVQVALLAAIIPLLFVNLTDSVYLRIPFTIIISILSTGCVCYFVGFDRQERAWLKTLVKSRIKKKDNNVSQEKMTKTNTH